MAEHILTGHKVAIKILNRRKIKQMDMEEKGDHLTPFPTRHVGNGQLTLTGNHAGRSTGWHKMFSMIR